MRIDSLVKTLPTMITMSLRVPICVLFVCVLAAGSSSCLARRRVIARKGASSTQPLLVSDRQTLLDKVTHQFEAVRDFNAEVDMVPALGTAEKSLRQADFSPV